jgi:DNA polymerase-3 subunit alpha
LGDFAERIDARLVNKRQLESLVAAGAFDALNPNRRQSNEAVEQILRHAGLAASDRASHQGSLFGGLGAAAGPSITLPDLPDWPAMERLKREFEAIGFYLSAHPLDAYGKTLERLGAVPALEAAERLLSGRGGGRVRLAGTPIAKQERTGKSGARFAFLQLSDMSGVFEVMLFSELLSASRELIEQGVPLLIAADGRVDGEQLRYTAQTIEPLDKAAANVAASLRVYLSDAASVESLKSLLEREARGKGRVWVVAMSEGREIQIALKGGYRCSPPLRQAIKALGGVLQVEEV